MRKRTQQRPASSTPSSQTSGRGLGAGPGAGLNAEERTACHCTLAAVAVAPDSELRKSCYPIPGKGTGEPRGKAGPRGVRLSGWPEGPGGGGGGGGRA